MAGLRFNIDADITRFTQLVKRIQEVRKEMDKLAKFSPKYDKLYEEFRKIKTELDTMQKKFAEIQTALAQVDIAKGVVDSSQKIRKETDETSERIKHYADSLRGVKEQLQSVTDEIDTMSAAQRSSVSGANAVKQYAGLKAQLKVAADEMRSFAREQENIIKVQKAADGSITQLRRQLSLLTFQYDNLSRGLRSGATGKELIIQIQSVTKELNEAEQASMRFYRNVGNYASGWNGLNVQVQQLARELPSLAVSMNTFFLAISNNLPMLIDEIKLAQDRLKALKDEGKQGTPVWKQLAKSLLGWQTGLVVGITLLSSYGNELADWVKGLFKAKENIDILKEALAAYNNASLEGRKEAQGQLTRLRLLYNAAVDASKGTESQTKAVKALKEEFASSFESMSNQTIMLGKAKAAYDSLTQSIINNAKARAYVSKITEKQEERIELEEQLVQAKKNLEEAKSLQDLQESGNVRNTAGAAFAPITAGSKELADAAGDVNKFSKEVDVLTTKIASIDETTKRLEDSINISDLLFDPTKTPEKDKEVKYLDSYLQQKAIKKSEQDILDTITKSQLNAQKMVADLMQDGNVKELAQINANYDAKVAEIQKRERELLQTLQDAEYEQWKQANPDYQKKGLRFIPTVTELPQDKRTELDTEYSAAYQLQQNATAKLLSNTLAKYRDFAAQRTAIEKQMNDDISFLRSQRTESNTEEIDRAIQVAKDKAKESIQAVIDEENKALANQDNDFLRMLFGDVSQMALSDLSELLKQARQLRSYLSGKGDKEGITFISPEQLKAIEESPEELDKLKKALDKLLGAGKKQNKWDSIFETFKKGFADLKGAQGFKEISGSIGMISGAAGQAAGEIATMFEAMGKDSAANVIGSLGEVLNSISNIGQAFATGGTVAGAFAAVGEIFSLIGKGAQETAKHRQVLENVMNDTIAQQREYNLLLLEQNLLYEKASTIFGVDSYAKAENAVRVLKDAISDLNGVLEGDTEQQKKFAYRKTGSAALDKVLNRNYSQSKDRYSGLADIEIKTGSYTTGAWFWKKQHDVYTSILDVYPKLIDANGEFNKELAESIINTREMSDEDKAALQGMIDLAEQAEAAYDSLNDYMTDIFGELGNSMSNALVDAFKNGTDAAEAFTQSVSEMLETLAEQMIYSVTLAPLLEEAQEDMMSVMKNQNLTDEERFLQWTNILKGLASDAIAKQDEANRLYEAFRQSAGDMGFDVFSPDATREASQKTGITASQDSVDKIDGMVTTMMGHTYSINENVNRTANGIDSLLDYASSGLSLTTDIERTAKAIENQSRDALNHLANIDSYTSNLVEIREYMYAMKSGIDTLNTKGITLKR